MVFNAKEYYAFGDRCNPKKGIIIFSCMHYSNYCPRTCAYAENKIKLESKYLSKLRRKQFNRIK